MNGFYTICVPCKSLQLYLLEIESYILLTSANLVLPVGQPVSPQVPGKSKGLKWKLTVKSWQLTWWLLFRIYLNIMFILKLCLLLHIFCVCVIYFKRKNYNGVVTKEKFSLPLRVFHLIASVLCDVNRCREANRGRQVRALTWQAICCILVK